MKNRSIVDAVDSNVLGTLTFKTKHEKGRHSSILEPQFLYQSQENSLRPALDRSILKKVLLDDKFMKYCNLKYRISLRMISPFKAGTIPHKIRPFTIQLEKTGSPKSHKKAGKDGSRLMRNSLSTESLAKHQSGSLSDDRHSQFFESY